MTAPISEDLAKRISAAIAAKAGLVVVKKTGDVWTVLGLVFDGLRFVGLDVPSGHDVVGEYAQTVPLTPGLATPFSAAVLMPDRVLSPDSIAELMVHEGTHGLQSRADAAWGVKYLQHREYRAGTAEGPAFAGGLAYRWARTGQVPASLDSFEHILRAGYDAQDHAVVGHDVIELIGTEISHGVIRNPLARLAIAITYRDEPEAIHPAALLLMQANCPEGLVIA